MSGKYALIIANTEYTDPGLAQLTAPGKDAQDFERVLKDPDICAFDHVITLVNEPGHIVREAVEEFFHEKRLEDLLLLYFSGHGVRDEFGEFYLAVKNTVRSRLRATGIKSGFIHDLMDRSRSKRKVLILDCCNSGAFAQGTKAGGSLGTATAFGGGFGSIILTASDSVQFAWEGDQIIGDVENSLFTHFLVEGLEGKADRDGDGHINVDELYDYAFEQVKLATNKQTPSKFSEKQQGEIILRQGKIIKPLPLPDELINEINDSRTNIRQAAVQKLEEIVKGKNLGMARSARQELERIAEKDDSRLVSSAAKQIVDVLREKEQKAEEEQRRKEDEKRIAAEIAEQERLALEKAEAERKAAEEQRRIQQREERIAKRKKREELLLQEKLEAELKAREEIKRREEEEAQKKKKLEEEALQKKAELHNERLQQYMQTIKLDFTRHVRGWGQWKTEEAQARQNVRLDNDILDLYFDGKGYLFTPVADDNTIKKAARLARFTNIYVIAYQAPNDLIEMVRKISGVELYRLTDRIKTANGWSWFDFDIFIANPNNLSKAP